MRASHPLRMALVFLVGLAPLPAAAGMLVGASLKLEFGSLPAITFVGTGVSGSSSGPLYATLAPGTGFAGTLTGTIPTSAAPPISGLYFTVGANAAGVFSGPSASLVGGSMAVDVHICVEAYGGLCLLNVYPPFGTPQTVTPPVVGGIGITMHGSAWTAGTAAIGVLPTTTAAPGGTTTRMGSNGLNANGNGTLVLVSAVNVLTNIAGQLPSFATLTLQYVPEPGALAWVAPSVAALGLAARRLRARRAARP